MPRAIVKRLTNIQKTIYSDEKEREYSMKEVLILLGVIALWFVLNRWILPRLGVPT